MYATLATVMEALRRWGHRIVRALLLSGALAGMALGSVAYAQIAFRSASPSNPQPIPQFRAASSGGQVFGVPAPTRFYIQNVAADVDPATERGSWNVGAGSYTPLKLARTKSGTVASKAVAEGTSTSFGTKVMMLKLVSEPIPTDQTISGTLNWAIAVRQSDADLNAYFDVYVYVLACSSNCEATTPSTADTSRGELLNSPDMDGNGYGEWGNNSTNTYGWGPCNSGDGCPQGGNPQTLTPVAAKANDRIVIEIGYKVYNTHSNSYTGTMWYGGTGGDQTFTWGTGGSNTLTSWFEFSQNLFPKLTIPTPDGTVAGDVMIASIGFRPNTATIAQPAGWTEVQRINNTNATASSLAVYYRTAGATEPASYSWTLGGGATDAAGGIQTFFNVDTTDTPVIPLIPSDQTAGQSTAWGKSHATPSITTTSADMMVVTSHSLASSNTWSAPTGGTPSTTMNLGFTAQSKATSSSGQATAGAWEVQSAAKATGAKTSTISGDEPTYGDVGNTHILALRPARQSSMTINKPAGTIQNDVMIATLGFRPPPDVPPDTVTVTPPGAVGDWQLVRRVNNSSSAGSAKNSLAVYWRKAGASEPASYTWNFSAPGYLAGGILSFSGVDTVPTPIVSDAGNCTQKDTVPCALTLSHETPDISTGSTTDTMLVTSHTYASPGTWTAPAGMTVTQVDVRHGGQSLAAYYELRNAAGLTGTRTAVASSDPDLGNAHILALKPVPPPPSVLGRFNAYETSTAAGAITGVIKTKVAGVTTSLAIIALNAAKTAISTGFTGWVRIEVLNASNNTGWPDGNGCGPNWTLIQTLFTEFVSSNQGRKTVSFTEANSYQNLRIRISYPWDVPTMIGCSNDNFALRPSSFYIANATDGDWQTAGTTRTLNNTTVPGGNVHKAGRPFTVLAYAINGAGSPALTTNYTGAPTPTLTDCGASSACPSTPGTLTLTTNFSSGVLNTNTASYAEVGSFNLQLMDTTFSDVDAADGSPADCTASGRYICSYNTIAVGRFVPDHFAVALNTPAFGSACGSFTYLGQKFNYSTAPVITLTARNFAGGTTTHYAGALWRITNASLAGKAYTAALPGSLNTSGITGTDPVIFSAGAGTGTLTFGSGTGLFFNRGATPVAPFDADISLAIDVKDLDNVIYAGNPARFGTATAGNGIAFTSGKSLRFGRLTLRNANGPQLLSLPVPVEAQYWSGAPINGFLTNTLDSCTTIASANDAMGNYTGNLSGSPTCETAVTSSGTLSAGRGALMLAAPGSANSGSVDLTVNLGASASGSTCTTQGGAPGSATTANLPHLQGNWSGGAYDQNPTARATFGISRGFEEVIFVRENF